MKEEQKGQTELKGGVGEVEVWFAPLSQSWEREEGQQMIRS